MCIVRTRSFREFAARRVRSGGEFGINKSLITGLVVDGQERTVKLGYDPGRSIPVENGLLVLREPDDRR